MRYRIKVRIRLLMFVRKYEEGHIHLSFIIGETSIDNYMN